MLPVIRKAALILFATNHHKLPNEDCSRHTSGDKFALPDELNSFAGGIVFIALVAGELWKNFYHWAERTSAAFFFDHLEPRSAVGDGPLVNLTLGSLILSHHLYLLQID